MRKILAGLQLGVLAALITLLLSPMAQADSGDDRPCPEDPGGANDYSTCTDYTAKAYDKDDPEKDSANPQSKDESTDAGSGVSATPTFVIAAFAVLVTMALALSAVHMVVLYLLFRLIREMNPPIPENRF